MRPLLAPALFGLLVCTSPLRAQSTEAAFVEWAAEVAIPIDLERGIDVALLAPLVADKRFVYLGEPDHYIQEKYAFRLAGLRALHALGWRHLGMEMGHSDGLRYERYLQAGDEDELTDIGIYASIRSVPDAISAGGFLGSEMTYARAVRAIADGPQRVHYFGFDVDTRPGNGIEDARARLAGNDAARELALVLEDAWNSEQPVDELEALLAELETGEGPLVAGLPPERLLELRLDLFALVESLRFQARPSEDLSNVTGLLESFAARERAMFRIFDAQLEALPADARVVLTGHNMHLGRSWENTRWAEQNESFRIPLWRTIGTHVSERFPGQVLSIWLLYDHGERLSGALGQPRAVDSIPDTLESLLATLPHDALLLPLASDDPRSAWLDEEQNFRVNGGLGWGHLRRLTDVVLFVREAHVPRRTE